MVLVIFLLSPRSCHFSRPQAASKKGITGPQPELPRLRLEKYLCSAPSIFPFVLTWAADNASKQTVEEMLSVVPLSVRMGRIYRIPEPGMAVPQASALSRDGQVHLLGMICFYGRHYVRCVCVCVCVCSAAAFSRTAVFMRGQREEL